MSEHRSEGGSVRGITVCVYESVHKRMKVFMSVLKEPVCMGHLLNVSESALVR